MYQDVAKRDGQQTRGIFITMYLKRKHCLHMKDFKSMTIDFPSNLSQKEALSPEFYVLELVCNQYMECMMYPLPHFRCNTLGNGYIVDGRTHFT